MKLSTPLTNTPVGGILDADWLKQIFMSQILRWCRQFCGTFNKLLTFSQILHLVTSRTKHIERLQTAYMYWRRCVSLQIIILCDSHQYRVAVNGVHLLVYKHRVQDLSRITQLEVTGDVTLKDVKLLWPHQLRRQKTHKSPQKKVIQSADQKAENYTHNNVCMMTPELKTKWSSACFMCFFHPFATLVTSRWNMSGKFPEGFR